MSEYSYNFQDKELLIIATPEDIEDNWLWAALSYFGPLVLLVMMIKRESVFAIYHARQGMGLFIISIACFFIWIGVNLILPRNAQFVLFIVTIIFSLVLFGMLGLVINGIINAYKGKMTHVYLIGKFFEKEGRR